MVSKLNILRIYVTLLPCNECAKLVIQSRHSQVHEFYLLDLCYYLCSILYRFVYT